MSGEPEEPPDRSWLRFDLGISDYRVTDADGRYRCATCDVVLDRKASYCDLHKSCHLRNVSERPHQGERWTLT